MKAKHFTQTSGENKKKHVPQGAVSTPEKVELQKSTKTEEISK
jgi:hypothetical protein